MQAIPAALAVGGALLKGSSALKAGNFNNRLAQYNAHQIETEGAADELDIANQGRALEGQQIVSQAGSGFDLGTGSGLDLLRQTETETSFDILKRRRQSRADAINQRLQGQAAKKAGRGAFVGSLIEAASAGVSYAGGFKG